MSNTILLIFEGEIIEGQIFKSIEKYFFPASNGQQIIRSSFKAEIYQLWNEVKDDVNLDIVEVLKQRPDSDIRDIDRRNVSEVHLFFDHDGHSHSDTMSPQDYNEMINKLLNTFNNEFEQGKLWLSYPMTEAIKHCTNNPADCFKDAFLDMSNNINYKNIIDKISNYKDIKKYDENTWHYLTIINIQRTFCLVNNTYETVSDYQSIKHWFENNAIIIKQIQEKQYKNFILPKNQIVALSPFPLFLINYFGEKYFNKCKNEIVTKNCSFYCYQNNK
ncbi:hypothetical protein R84B8_02376 [Treponema sp. R8-4-B8]